MSEAGKTKVLGKEWDFASGISVGLVRGFMLAISLFALASIVFTDELESFVLSGTGMFFVGTAILCLFLAFLGKFPAPVATTPIPVALVMIAIAQSLELAGRDLYLTFVLSIVGCTLLSGMFFLGIGYFRIASFFRFVPFTVSAGALAGSGILILLMALNLAGLDWRPESWDTLREPMALWKALLSVLLGVSFIVATRIWRYFWVLPALFAVFCVLFHVGLVLLDISVDEARTAGMFLNADWSVTLWPAYGLADLNSVAWGAIGGQVFNATVLFIVLLILTVVSFAQLELGANMEFDWNREFKLHGVANLLSGAGGGIPGATVASATLPNIALHANTPVTSIVMALVLLAVVAFGSDVLRLMPLPATSAFLISIAVPLITEWLLNSRKRLQRAEFGMLVLICVTIVFVGFLEGIILGLVLSLVFFIVRLSNVRLIKGSYTVRERSSHKIRSIPEQSILKVYGSRARIYPLQGYVFFGSAHSLANELKESLSGDLNLSCVVIDFEEVSGFDLAALDSLRSFIQRANAQNVQTILCSTSDKLAQEIRRDFPPTLVENVTWVETQEDALIEAEDILLANYESDIADDPDLRDLVRLSTNSELTHHLDRQVQFEELIADLTDWVETVEYEDGEAISTRGESPSGLQLLMAGRASVVSDDGSTLYQCGAGSVIESASAIEEAESTVSIKAEGSCKTLLVQPSVLATLDVEENQLALRLYRYILSEPAPVS
ncbi:MAG: SulP family inorganic anion transporter [Gammaproteobacteria bacterium]|nr:SulP family inorganic anion transporter [Gammaproteobacteria bacterium]